MLCVGKRAKITFFISSTFSGSFEKSYDDTLTLSKANEKTTFAHLLKNRKIPWIRHFLLFIPSIFCIPLNKHMPREKYCTRYNYFNCHAPPISPNVHVFLQATYFPDLMLNENKRNTTIHAQILVVMSANTQSTYFGWQTSGLSLVFLCATLLSIGEFNMLEMGW